MNGMIFAAGLGTRLYPLTETKPKALVTVRGKTLLESVIEKMKQAGVERLVINVHHFAEQVEAFLVEHRNFDMDIRISDERELLLDTGGGLLKARPLFLPDRPLLIHNVDIRTDLDLSELVRQYRLNPVYGLLVVQAGGSGRVLKFDDKGMLKGWENKRTGEQKVVDPGFYQSSDYSFCGIQLLSADYVKNIQHQGPFSIIDEHLAQAVSHTMKAYIHSGICRDLGTPEAVLREENAERL